MTRKFTRIAMAAIAATALLAPATGALAASKTERALIGAMLGGAAGAVLTRGKTEGVVVGAAAGAALGAITDKDRRHRYGRRHSAGYSDASYDGYDRADYGRYDTRYDRRSDERDSRYGSDRYTYGYGR